MIRGNYISGNDANYAGGGISGFYGGSHLIENIITGNRALYAGGGIHFKFGDGYPMDRCVIAGNETQVGGGVYIESHPGVEIINCTISENNAETMGGGVYVATFSHSNLTNTIVWGNWAPEHPAMFVMSTDTVTVAYSDIEGGFEGVGNIEADPLFADGGNWDFGLTWANYPAEDSTKSPCIDGGNPEQEYNDPDGTRNDMGVYYFEQTVSVNDLTRLATTEGFQLNSPQPNPFNSSTVISFNLEAAGRVELKVFDITGREAESLVNGHLSLGKHRVTWEAEGFGSGVYFVRLDMVSTAESRHHRMVKKAMLVK